MLCTEFTVTIKVFTIYSNTPHGYNTNLIFDLFKWWHSRRFGCTSGNLGTIARYRDFEPLLISNGRSDRSHAGRRSRRAPAPSAVCRYAAATGATGLFINLQTGGRSICTMVCEHQVSPETEKPEHTYLKKKSELTY